MKTHLHSPWQTHVGATIHNSFYISDAQYRHSETKITIIIIIVIQLRLMSPVHGGEKFFLQFLEENELPRNPELNILVLEIYSLPGSDYEQKVGRLYPALISLTRARITGTPEVWILKLSASAHSLV